MPETVSTIPLIGVQIWLLALTAAMTALTLIWTLPVIIKWLKKKFARESDYVIEVLEGTRRPPDEIYDTTVSGLYIVRMRVTAPSEVPDLSKIRFSISYKNIGKKLIENCYLRVYLLDSLSRVFAEWHGEVGKDKFNKGVTFAVDSVTSKGKGVYGNIHICALAYDKTDDREELISYLLSSIDVQAPSSGWWFLISAVTGAAAAGVVWILIFNFVLK